MISLLDLFSRQFRTLALWQWAILLAIPPLVVLLYFLKLKRRPLEVPSTFLWHRTIEDLHVNSLWQRLRKNLLLLLQLLVLLLAILAVLRPSWQGSTLTENRYIFLVDTSASMSSSDVQPTRLEETKKRLIELVDQQLRPGSLVMIISFSDRAVVEQPFTNNRRLLRRKIRGIRPTEHTSRLDEALRVAAGLANPGRLAADEGDVAAADVMPATLLIFSDGRFADRPERALGVLKPVYVPVGKPDAHNVAITAFSVGRNPARREELQVYAQVQNFTEQPQRVTANLLLNDQEASLLDAAEVRLPAAGTAGVQFTLNQPPDGSLRLQLDSQDHLRIDDRAFAAVNPPHKARVLVVTPGNDALQTLLETPHMQQLATIEIAEPGYLSTEAYKQAVEQGQYDLIIYDRCQPGAMPRANTFFIGSLPVDGRWQAEEKVSLPEILDTENTHPLMRFVALGDIKWIIEATPIVPPTGATTLVDSHLGTLLAIAPREGFEDLVLALPILGTDEDGNTFANTDWHIRTSFPIFVANAITHLGGSRADAVTPTVKPGQPIGLRTQEPVERVTVLTPSGDRIRVQRSAQNQFLFGQTDETGIYAVQEEGKQQPTQWFAVNLFDPLESDIRPKPVVQTAFEEIPGQQVWESTRRELWKWLLGAALVLLIVEWYIYNRRVYV